MSINPILQGPNYVPGTELFAHSLNCQTLNASNIPSVNSTNLNTSVINGLIQNSTPVSTRNFNYESSGTPSALDCITSFIVPLTPMTLTLPSGNDICNTILLQVPGLSPTSLINYSFPIYITNPTMSNLSIAVHTGDILFCSSPIPPQSNRCIWVFVHTINSVYYI
jgi:hypothetical protein